MTELKDTRERVPSGSTAIWLSMFTLLIGAFISGIGLQLIPYDPAKIHAPYWVIVVGGLVFMSAGFAMLSASWTRYPRLQTLFGLGILLGLTLISNWVAFGDGERRFTSTSTFNGRTVDSRAVDERTGRVAFGIGAVLLDIFLVAMLVKLCRQHSD